MINKTHGRPTFSSYFINFDYKCIAGKWKVETGKYKFVSAFMKHDTIN